MVNQETNDLVHAFYAEGLRKHNGDAKLAENHAQSCLHLTLSNISNSHPDIKKMMANISKSIHDQLRQSA